jgi:hypothetical protein
MYLVGKKIRRQKDRTRGKLYKAKLKAKNKRRRKQLEK